MLKNHQQTIKSQLVGLVYIRERTDITLYPAGGQVYFLKIRFRENNLIYANYKNVSSTLCTTLK